MRIVWRGLEHYPALDSNQAEGLVVDFFARQQVPAPDLLTIELHDDLPEMMTSEVLEPADGVLFEEGLTELPEQVLGYFVDSAMLVVLHVNPQLRLPDLLETLAHELDHVAWAQEGKVFDDEPEYRQRAHEVRARLAGAAFRRHWTGERGREEELDPVIVERPFDPSTVAMPCEVVGVPRL